MIALRTNRHFLCTLGWEKCELISTRRRQQTPTHPDMRRVTAIVSGGGSGLGLAAARRIVQQGGRVLISDVNTAGHDAAKELGPAAAFAHADCTSEADIAAALDLAEQTFGHPVSAAINTAGTAYPAKTVSRKGQPHPLDAFENVLHVNAVGSFNVARLAAARMMSREPDADTGERGVIVHTASIAAFDGQAGQAAYAASKGALVGMTLPMARDLAPLGIRVCTIAPGIFDTPMSTLQPNRVPCSRDPLLPRVPSHCSRRPVLCVRPVAKVSDDVRTSLFKAIPFPSRFGRPDEYAAYVETILLNPYLNGEVTRLDGAVRMG